VAGNGQRDVPGRDTPDASGAQGLLPTRARPSCDGGNRGPVRGRGSVACFAPLARRGGFAAIPLASPAPSWRFRGSARFGRFRTEPGKSRPRGAETARIRSVPSAIPAPDPVEPKFQENRTPGSADAATWARRSRRERTRPRACPSHRRRRTPERVAPWPRSRLPNNDDMISCETVPSPPKNTASTLSRKESMRSAQGIAQAGIAFHLKFPVEENRVVLQALRDLSTSPCTERPDSCPGTRAQSEQVEPPGLRQPASAGRRSCGGSLRGD